MAKNSTLYWMCALIFMGIVSAGIWYEAGLQKGREDLKKEIIFAMASDGSATVEDFTLSKSLTCGTAIVYKIKPFKDDLKATRSKKGPGAIWK